MQEAQAQKEDTQKIFTESYLIKNQLQQTLNATLTQVEQHNSDQPIEIIKKSIDKFTQENKQLVEHIQSEESQVEHTDRSPFFLAPLSRARGLAPIRSRRIHVTPPELALCP